MRSLRVLTGDVHRECERGKERVEKFSLLPAGDKRRALTDILYHIFLHSLFCFHFVLSFPSLVLSLSLYLFSFFFSLFHIQVSVHLCSRQPIKKSWFLLTTIHLYALCVCVWAFMLMHAIYDSVYECVCAQQKDGGIAIGGGFIRRSETLIHTERLHREMDDSLKLPAALVGKYMVLRYP